MTSTDFPRADLAKPKTITLTVHETCGRCGGDGIWKGWFKGTCYGCGGHGKLQKERAIWHFPRDWSDDQCLQFDEERLARNEARRQAKRDAKRQELEQKAEEAFQLIEAEEDLANAFHFLFRDFHGEDKIGPGEPRFSSPGRSVTGIQRAQERAWRLALTAADIFFRFRDRGQLTTKQRQLIVNGACEAEEQLRAAEAHFDRLQKAPVLEAGRREIEGRVLSIKVVDNGYTVTDKVLIEQADLNKVWGTLPRSLDEAEVGDLVRLTATVDPSDDDTHFGFFSWPTKGGIVEKK